MKTWMRKRGDRVIITSGRYAGDFGTVESNVYQRTGDYPDEFHNGYRVMLDTEELVTVVAITSTSQRKTGLPARSRGSTR